MFSLLNNKQRMLCDNTLQNNIRVLFNQKPIMNVDKTIQMVNLGVDMYKYYLNIYIEYHLNNKCLFKKLCEEYNIIESGALESSIVAAELIKRLMNKYDVALDGSLL